MTAGKKRKLKAKSKVWLEVNGLPVFGDGKAEMLEQIARTGSLSAAARSLGISYRRLWGRLVAMERRLGFRVVERCAGGRGGGGAKLTPAGKKLLDRYQRFRRGTNAMVDKRFRKIFTK